jgi:glycerol-3-phosphate dehydrogenase
VHDRLTDRHVTVGARHMVNATGVFSEDVEALAGTTPHVQVEPSKGVHLVLAREDLQLGESAIVLPETDDGRILFIVPWETRAIYGTTDTGTGDLDHPAANRDDIAYLLDHLDRYLSVSLTEEDIISTYAGYRPLLKPRTNSPRSSAKLSRTHAVLQSPSGVVTIVGGKLTTYRRMAQDTVDVLNQRDGSPLVHPTTNMPLHGSAGWPVVKRDLDTQGKALGLSAQTVDHLGKSYGSNGLAVLSLVESDPTLAELLVGDLPYIKAEVVYACRNEMAMTPCDVLARRTAITLLDRQRGMGVVDSVAALMARELGWSSAAQQSMIDAFNAAMHAQMVAEKSL